ncbi:hypothetical protein NQ318_010673 [Aromia moschata]|uniref:Uncharacterized protein n=1 Tax=Aromia moschata TaxID=1265417 RepID=A0AAV8XF10_9CUCU|nr:hypothetical protein NQ318_010673 [Aromia moschata]
MHDGAPPHFALPVRQYLHEHFRHRWIGRGSKFVLPLRNPNLNPLDFSSWSNSKDLVYQKEVNSLQELEQRIQAANKCIRGFLYSLLQLLKRINFCLIN